MSHSEGFGKPHLPVGNWYALAEEGSPPILNTFLDGPRGDDNEERAVKQARIQGGQGGLAPAPPPPTKNSPPNSQARIQGGGQEGLGPPLQHPGSAYVKCGSNGVERLFTARIGVWCGGAGAPPQIRANSGGNSGKARRKNRPEKATN